MSREQHIGHLLRQLRLDHLLTGVALSEKAGISQSRLSKIETGAVANIKPDELVRILNILKAPKTIRQQIDMIVSHQSTLSLSRQYTTNFDPNTVFELERKTSEWKVFAQNIIPVLFQTGEYRRALLTHYGLTDKMIQENMRMTIKRQDALWDAKRKTHAIIHEAALYTAPASLTAQRVQLDRLERLISTGNPLKIGIVALEAGLAMIENGSFVLYDTHRVAMVVAGMDIISEDSEDVARHFTAFRELDHKALYGSEAIEIVRKALNHFA